MSVRPVRDDTVVPTETPAHDAPINPDTPPRTLANMALRGHERQRWEAAGHPNTPPQVLHRLAQEPMFARVIATNPSTDSRTLTMLLSKDPGLAAYVAGNPRCPERALAVLAEHEAPVVRLAVASNVRCTPELLAALAMDNNDHVRTKAAENTGCPESARVAAGLLGFAI